MNINPHNLLKKELVELLSGRCKHRHLYIEHPNCWYKEKDREPRIGYFDIETGGMNANFDIMLCYSIKTRNKKEFHRGCVIKEEIQSFNFDKNVCKKLIQDLLRYDIIITYYGTKFDIPFVRSRSLQHKLDFPVFGSIKHKDVYYMVKRLLKLHKRSLESTCAFLDIEGKNHIRGSLWMKAKHGDKKALKYVQKHCDLDVMILEKLHKRLEAFVKNTNRSI